MLQHIHSHEISHGSLQTPVFLHSLLLLPDPDPTNHSQAARVEATETIMSPTATSANGSSPEKTILVVGAGPVGLFTALKLAQAGLNVEVIDLLPGRSTAPRAAGYYGGALVALRKAGVYDEMLRKGYLADGLAWRALPEDDGKGGKTFGKSIARMPVLQPVLKDSPAEMYGHPELEGGMVILPQSSFAKILEDQALATGRVRIHWDTQIADIAEEGETVVATVKPATIGREEVVNTWTLRGAYLVGADGGRSAVRKLLKIQLPGHTWPERLIATDVSLFNDFVSDTPAHFVVSRPHYAVVIPLTKAVAGQATLWRYSVAIDPTDMRPDEEILSDDNLAQLYDMTMVGKRPLQYEVKRRAIYNIHQRLVTTMRRGRCLLAGDAAHLCNVSDKLPPFSNMKTGNGPGSFHKNTPC